LGIRRAHAVGHLELLFHFAAEFAPEGDVGRFSDKRIAAALDWGGAPGKLVSALVESGWLDPHPTARLVVHGWAEHADHTTLQKLSRAGKKPIQSNHEDAGKVCDQIETTGSTLIALPLPLPEPEPLPEPLPLPEPEPPRAEVCPVRTEKRISGDAPEKAPARSRLSRFGLPVNWTDADVVSLQQQLSAFMDGDQPPADLTEWILHDLARRYSLSASDICGALQAAWRRDGAPGKKNAPRQWEWFYEVLRRAFVPGYAARLPEAPATGCSALDRETFQEMTEAIELIGAEAGNGIPEG
jgi:hypothetical protein